MKQKTAFKEKSAWYTALVILYLLFCVGLSLAYRDTGAVLSGWQLGILEPDGTYTATSGKSRRSAMARTSSSLQTA